jgi:hypothetical protein
MHEPKRDEDAALRIGPPEDHAAGVPAVTYAMRCSLQEIGPLRTARTLARLNQHGGYDCPACAATYHPERNALVPLDPVGEASGTPTSKSIVVRIEPHVAAAYPPDMAYSTAEAQQEMLDEVAIALDDLAVALADLGEAYELLDDPTADRLEGELFKPVQLASGRLKRTAAGFAERHGRTVRDVAPATPGHPSQGVRGFLDRAGSAAAQADGRLAELQDSLRPVDVGDAELRAGLSEVRRMLGDVPGRSRLFVRTLGR